MSKELEDTLDSMVATIERLSKAFAEMSKHLESLNTRIASLEQGQVSPRVRGGSAIELESVKPGIRGGRL